MNELNKIKTIALNELTEILSRLDRNVSPGDVRHFTKLMNDVKNDKELVGFERYVFVQATRQKIYRLYSNIFQFDDAGRLADLIISRLNAYHKCIK